MLSHVLLHDICRPPFILDQLGPIVVVLPGSTDVHHVVDAAGATEESSTGDMMDPVPVPFLNGVNQQGLLCSLRRDVLTCGAVYMHQSYSVSSNSWNNAPGVSTSGSSMRYLPASMTPTVTSRFSLRRAAMAHPAVPPPPMR